MQLIPNGRVWIDTHEGAFLGYGRIELLENIKEFGSIRQAATEMKMSYRQAWELIEQINQAAGIPIVISIRGGKGGGSATVTPEGNTAIKQFHNFNKAFQKFLLNYKKKSNK